MFRWIAACAALMVLCAGEACAFGPLAHAYIAQRATGVTDRDIMYGAMMPDCANVIRDRPDVRNAFASMTHCEFDRLAPSWFAIGFATHNNYWGGDLYTHSHHDPGAPDVYPTVVMRAICDEFGITMYQAEDVFDMVIDLLLRVELGASAGARVEWCASGPGHAQDLVAAFAQPLSDRVSGLTLSEAEEKIRDAVAAYRQALGIYGQQLQLDEAALRSIMPMLLVVYMGCDLQMARDMLVFTEDLCSGDYRPELDAMCRAIAVEMDAYPRYALPIYPYTVVVGFVLIAAASSLRVVRGHFV